MKKSDIYVIIITSGGGYSDAKILGRTVGEFTRLGVGALQYTVTDCAGGVLLPENCGYLAVIYDDMPLVTAEILEETAVMMRAKNIKKISVGRGFMCTRKAADDENPAIGLNLTEFLSVTDTNTLKVVYNKLRERIIEKNIGRGAVILDNDVVIDDTATVMQGAVIEGGSRILGTTVIFENAVIKCSRIEDSVIGKNTVVGPYAYVRMNSHIGDNVRLGDFVEVKNSTLEDGVKSAHLTYIGDAEIGCKTNVGCGTVFCNYDGKAKHKTVVGKDVFIGANVNLVAPLTVGSGAFIAAGTTVTKDLAEDTFCIGRVKQNEKPKRK